MRFVGSRFVGSAFIRGTVALLLAGACAGDGGTAREATPAADETAGGVGGRGVGGRGGAGTGGAGGAGAGGSSAGAGGSGGSSAGAGGSASNGVGGSASGGAGGNGAGVGGSGGDTSGGAGGSGVSAPRDAGTMDGRPGDVAADRASSGEAGPGPSVPAGTIGFVGCSVSNGAVGAYRGQGGTRFWAPITGGDGYGGGHVAAWSEISDGSQYWKAFRGGLAAQPPKAIWWELCASQRFSSMETIANATAVYDEIKKRAPNAVIYISSMMGYTGGHVCGIAGAEGPARMQKLVDQLVSGGRGERGPVMGPLAGNQTSDGCHTNPAGGEILGKQLVAFFGK
jgi:hypothetical protein